MKSTVYLSPEVCRDRIETGSKVQLSAHPLFQISSNWWMFEIITFPGLSGSISFTHLCGPAHVKSHLSDIENCGFQTQRTSLNH